MGPENQRTTRPITDRVKTAVFDALEHSGRLRGAVVLDIFSGTGSIGLECLSRGAAHATFVEKDRSARERLKRNLSTIGVGREGEIIGSDGLAAGLIPALGRSDYTLIFMDPPYRMLFEGRHRQRLGKQMSRLAEASSPGALTAVRVEAHAEALAAGGWRWASERRVGSMRMDYYERAGDSGEAPGGEAGEAGEA